MTEVFSDVDASTPPAAAHEVGAFLSSANLAVIETICAPENVVVDTSTEEAAVDNTTGAPSIVRDGSGFQPHADYAVAMHTPVSATVPANL
jgi:hypothetical protein